jgi:hypothetical protein
MSKSKKVEDDVVEVLQRLRRDKKIDGYDSDWSKHRREAMMIVTVEYVEAQKFDEIFAYLLNQWDGGGGYDYFEKISDKIFGLNENDRAKKMWTTLVAFRKRANSKSEALSSMQHFLTALQKAGETDAIEKLEAEIKLFASGTQAKSQVKKNKGMSEQAFWGIIEDVRDASHHIADRTEKLRETLSNLPIDEIEQFAKLFEARLSEAYTWDLWALAYIAFGGCSDDGFNDFRAWLISEGKETFETLLKDPNSIRTLRLSLCQLESLPYAVYETYKSKAGKPLKLNVPFDPTPKGREWSESDLEKRYPDIWSYFYEKR